MGSTYGYWEWFWCGGQARDQQEGQGTIKRHLEEVKCQIGGIYLRIGSCGKTFVLAGYHL